MAADSAASAGGGCIRRRKLRLPGTGMAAICGRPLAVLAVVTTLAGVATPAIQARKPLRWVFVHSQLVAPGGMDTFERVCRRASAAGANGILLAESSFSRPSPITPADTERARKVRSLAAELGLEIVPAVFSPATILAADRNLAEGMPVRDALFVVHDGTARIEPEGGETLRNGSFEDGSGSPAEWQVRSDRGIEVAPDTSVRHSGSRSLRVITTTKPEGRAVISQDIAVLPWRQYHLSTWARTQDFKAGEALQPWVIGENGRSLNYSRWSLKPQAEWMQLHAVFNSQASRRVTLRFVVYQPAGSLWLDSVSLREVGLLNLLRRPGCPLTVRDESGTVYQEGKDFEPVSDPMLGKTDTASSSLAYHTPPEGIRLTAATRIEEAMRLRVSYYHAPVIFERRITQCLTEPATYRIMEKEAGRIETLLSPERWMMSHDEMRVINWCETCRTLKKTPGELLAANVRRCMEIVQKVHPGARLAVWSDMFDPNHNARDPYYLVNGSLSGSWDGLTSDVLIVNWNTRAREASLRWFADRGHHQLIAAYYDGSLTEIDAWKKASAGVPHVDGMMYTTWKRSFDDLEVFARKAWR